MTRAVLCVSKTFAPLAFLVARAGRQVGREELLAGVWQGVAVAESNLTVQMSNLRRVLAEHGGADMIITLPNRSYRFVARWPSRKHDLRQHGGGGSGRCRPGSRRRPCRPSCSRWA